MHRFRLKVELAGLILYQSILSFTEHQYLATLRVCRDRGLRHTDSSCHNKLKAALDNAGMDEDISIHKDYSVDFPDEVIGILIWENCRRLFDQEIGWNGSFNPLPYNVAGTIIVEKDHTGDFDWSWERIGE